MRLGEASRLKWIDVDLERKTIDLTETEKGGNPRIFDVSNKLVNMLLYYLKQASTFSAHETRSPEFQCFTNYAKV